MKFDYDEFDLSGVRTYPLAGRPSKVHHENFAQRVGSRDRASPAGSRRCRASLAAADLRAVIARDPAARTPTIAAIVWGLGAHVIKTGLAPVIIDLMERGFVSAIALNGAGLIHDFEVALAGPTSEDVDADLGPGSSAWRRRPAAS